MLSRRLYKTKICMLYQRGRCPRPNCNFAHGDAELRHAGGSFNGRKDYRSGDLRDKLERRHSPHRRYSPAREGRGHHSFQNPRQISYDKGSSRSRSPVRRSDSKRRKKTHEDGNNNASDDLGVSGSPEVRRRRENSSSDSDNDALREQLQQIQLDIKELDNHKSQLEISLMEKVDEERKLNGRISDLESQLTKEQENFKRTTTKIKKLIDVHDRYTKTKEELKRLEHRMQKYAHDLSLDTLKAGSIELQSIDNAISDGEPNDDYHKSSRNDGLLTKDLSSRKKLLTYSVLSEETTLGEPKRDDKQPEVVLRSEKSSGPDGTFQRLESISNVSEPLKAIKGKSATDEFRLKRGRTGSAYAARWEKGKVSEVRQSLLSTSVAANAVDELVEATEINEKSDAAEALKTHENGGVVNGTKPSYIPPPPPPLVSHDVYKQYEGDDEEVDVEKMDDEMLNIDINM